MSHLAVQWVALKTIVTKEVRRFTRIWQQTLVPPGDHSVGFCRWRCGTRCDGGHYCHLVITVFY